MIRSRTGNSIYFSIYGLRYFYSYLRLRLFLSSHPPAPTHTLTHPHTQSPSHSHSNYKPHIHTKSLKERHRKKKFWKSPYFLKSYVKMSLETKSRVLVFLAFFSQKNMGAACKVSGKMSEEKKIKNKSHVWDVFIKRTFPSMNLHWIMNVVRSVFNIRYLYQL